MKKIISRKFSIITFGCQQNVADSERIESVLNSQGMVRVDDINTADYIVINTCMVRQMAENRVYGIVYNLGKLKHKNSKLKIVVTGCMVGMAVREKSGNFLKLIKERMPAADEFLPIEEIGFDHEPVRTDQVSAWVPISNGCNNFCTFCVVPFTRGREISRPYEDIIRECKELAKKGYKNITLLGMNVNSYGADLVAGKENIQVMRDLDKKYFSNSKLKNKNFKLNNKNFGRKLIYVKHLGRYRIPTLFPYLLEDVAKIPGIEHVDFMSSNPWDFSEELIDVVARNKNITRLLHFALQSGSNSVLKRMNRWYTQEEYLALLKNVRAKVPGVEFSTDIIVGFCGETEEEFQETVDLVKKAKFFKAYIARYSDRPMTAAHKAFKDDIPAEVKKRRWKILENLINQPNLTKMKEYKRKRTARS